MRYILIMGILCLAGCQNFTGPFAPRPPVQPDPRLSIREQESQIYDRYALPNESSKIGPPSGNAYQGLPSAGDR